MTPLGRAQDATRVHGLGEERRTRIADIVRRQSEGAGTGGSAGRAAAEERRARIASVVRQRGRVPVTDLAGFLGVGEPTLLRDLTVLERANVLRRTSQGAVVAVTGLTPFPRRGREDRGGVRAVTARLCLDLVDQGQTLFLDSGTVSQAVADALGPLRVTVLTNALGVAETLAGRPTAPHVLLGGELSPASRSLVGPVAAAALERFTVDIAFVGAGGLTESGVSVAATEDGQIQQIAIGRARRVVVTVEASAVGNADFFGIAGLRDVDDIVCDRPQPDLARWCRTHGIRLHHPAHDT
ncbi:DeoR/GlpR family DNA-binding transcription regulator [Streptomyces sp. NPDC006367]|uniref:DeoR/GlpR family DNA-binding transcription regulator n=1 Tax=unclassified Streptomyces TaxID=2593676 RepID=UPI0033A246EA